MKTSFGILPLLIAVFILACKNDRIAEGGTDQPNTISGKILSAEGVALSGARVTLHQGAFHPDSGNGVAWNSEPSIEEAITNAAGLYRFNQVKPGKYYVDVLSKDSSEVGVQSYLHADGMIIDPAITRLAKGGTFGGTISSSAVSTYALVLAGTHFRAMVKENRTFNFPSLPPGRYRLVGQAVTNSEPNYLILNTLAIKGGDKLILTSVGRRDDSLLLYNFENTKVRSLMKGVLFPLEDDTSGRVKVSFQFFDTIPMGPVISDLSLDSVGGYRGSSLRIFNPLDKRIQFFIGTSYYNFSRVTAISFFARTNGESLNFRIGFSSQVVKDGDGSFYANVKARPEWSRIVVQVKDIFAEGKIAADGLTWSMVHDKINLISIYPNNAQELWIDDLHLLGVNAEDLRQTYFKVIR